MEMVELGRSWAVSATSVTFPNNYSLARKWSKYKRVRDVGLFVGQIFN